MNGPFAFPIRVRIKSYERPKHLSNLLLDLWRQSAALGCELDLMVFDDGSSAPMTLPKDICGDAGWGWHDHDRFGKKGAWQLHNHMYATLRRAGPEDIIYFFDDDMRLCERFFGRTIERWRHLRAKDKATLHLMVDGSRDGRTCWTGVRPKRVDTHIRRIQWVDGSFMCQRRMLEALAFRVNPIDESRWERHPERSSGVGQQLSHRLHDAGLGMYQTERSHLVHASASSHYNPKERRKTPLRTERFIDGLAAQQRLERADEIECSVASIPSRVKTLKQVVECLYPQVDVLRVYLNGYESVPDFLDRERCVVARSQEHGDIGDIGKFFWSEEASGYQLTVDDDIHYPANYVDRMIKAVDRHRRCAVVGVHAITFASKEPPSSYYKGRRVRHFSLALNRDEACHLVGTGTMAYHASTLALTRADFPVPNMADLWVGRQTQRQRVPVIAVPRARNWLRCLPTTSSIFDAATGDDSEQTAIVVEQWPWRMYKMNDVAPRHHRLCEERDRDPRSCQCQTWRREQREHGIRRLINGLKQQRRRQ